MPAMITARAADIEYFNRSLPLGSAFVSVLITPFGEIRYRPPRPGFKPYLTKMGGVWIASNGRAYTTGLTPQSAYRQLLRQHMGL